MNTDVHAINFQQVKKYSIKTISVASKCAVGLACTYLAYRASTVALDAFDSAKLENIASFRHKRKFLEVAGYALTSLCAAFFTLNSAKKEVLHSN